jgi:hypothetical protein
MTPCSGKGLGDVRPPGQGRHRSLHLGRQRPGYRRCVQGLWQHRKTPIAGESGRKCPAKCVACTGGVHRSHGIRSNAGFP